MTKLFCFGLGYVATRWAETYSSLECQGTKQHEEIIFNQFQQFDTAILDAYTHFLISIPPINGQDLVLSRYADYFKKRGSSIKWIGYLSATNVYGDHKGEWVDEETQPVPLTEQGHHRLLAEKKWLSLFETHQCPVHIFRLSSIYGPHRSPFDRMSTPCAPLVDKPGHFFSRIHVDDICQVLQATIDHPHPGQIFNLSDNLPAESATVTEYAYALLNKKPPPRIPFIQVQISKAMRSYYNENKRVKNDKIKQELGVSLLYSTYKEGLKNCLDYIKHD